MQLGSAHKAHSSEVLKSSHVNRRVLQTYVVECSCTPLSFFPQPRCRGVSLVLGPHQHYLRTLQNRTPACKTDKTCNVKTAIVKIFKNSVYLGCGAWASNVQHYQYLLTRILHISTYTESPTYFLHSFNMIIGSSNGLNITYHLQQSTYL